jgi:anion-transporting  ArsA/GET3 family ATPase
MTNAAPRSDALQRASNEFCAQPDTSLVDHALVTVAGDLGALLENKRVLLCVGCGGVGKTTTSAALGLAAAKRGKRVLCLTIDPARRLAQSLGLDWASHEARSVDGALLGRVGVPQGGSLDVMRVDTKSTFDTLVDSLAPDAARRDRILNNVLYRYISTSLAGTQEYMAMEKLYALRNDPRYDVILLDTPPTANALDFLDAPERLVGAIDSPAIKWFADAFEDSGKFSLNLLAKSTAALLRGVGRVTGSGFIEQVAAFVADMNALFGGWRTRANIVRDALRGGDVAYVLVTTPDPLAIREVRFFADRLMKESMRVDAFVVNRVHPSFGDAPSVEALTTRLTEIGASDPKATAERVLEAGRNANLLARADRIHLMALDDLVADTGARRVDVPAAGRDVYDLDALSEVAEHLAKKS